MNSSISNDNRDRADICIVIYYYHCLPRVTVAKITITQVILKITLERNMPHFLGNVVQMNWASIFRKARRRVTNEVGQHHCCENIALRVLINAD